MKKLRRPTSGEIAAICFIIAGLLGAFLVGWQLSFGVSFKGCANELTSARKGAC